MDIHGQGRPYFPYAALAKLIREESTDLDLDYHFQHVIFTSVISSFELLMKKPFEITGVIDWDVAERAPAFVSMEPLSWL
jgi:hypothetical protein